MKNDCEWYDRCSVYSIPENDTINAMFTLYLKCTAEAMSTLVCKMNEISKIVRQKQCPLAWMCMAEAMSTHTMTKNETKQWNDSMLMIP